MRSRQRTVSDLREVIYFAGPGADYRALLLCESGGLWVRDCGKLRPVTLRGSVEWERQFHLAQNWDSSGWNDELVAQWRQMILNALVE
jgi:hypothetical protein